jgi:starch synthase (maltosyl-transferring)
VRARGWEPLVVSVLPPGPVVESVRATGIRTASLGLSRWRDLPVAVGRLRRLVAEFRPDVVQTSLWHANVLGRLALRRSGVPVVDSFEDTDPHKPRSRIWLDRTTHGLATAHVVVARAVADLVASRERLPRERLHVIPFGLDVEAWRPRGEGARLRRAWSIPDAARVVAWTGRLEAMKGLDVLIQAVAPLRDWRILLAGTGPLVSRLDGWRREAQLDGRLIHVGELSDVRPVLEAADVFALASQHEGMPLSLIEAMAFGRPVVAAAVGGIPEVVSDGRDGLLVAPGDAAALRTAIEHAAGRPELGQRARETVRDRFTAEAMAAAYDRLWRAVSAARPAPG